MRGELGVVVCARSFCESEAQKDGGGTRELDRCPGGRSSLSYQSEALADGRGPSEG